jgi:hypothetical protein
MTEPPRGQESKRFPFRYRGGREVTRLEAFSDAVFAFALTLLVVSLEVPRSFRDLTDRMIGFPAFAVCFALLIWIWYEHSQFYRRYSLQDGITLWLNSLLLFVVLFYVYPLKFLWSFLVTALLTRGSGVEGMLLAADVPKLFYVYGAGFAAVFLCFFLLYAHAHRRRDSLGLNGLERADTRYYMWDFFAVACVGLLSIALTLIGGSAWAPLAGGCYALIGVVRFVNGYRHGKRREKLERQLEGATAGKA